MDKVNTYPSATNEMRDGALLPRSAAASGRLVLSASDRRLSLLGCLARAGHAPKPHVASRDADTAIERLSEVITWTQRGMKNWVCDGLEFFVGAVGVLLYARGRRASGCVRAPWWPFLSKLMDVASEAVDYKAYISMV